MVAELSGSLRLWPPSPPFRSDIFWRLVRTLALANNRVGLEGIAVLQECGASLVGLVVHRAERARYRDEIIAVAGLPPEAVIEAPALRTPEGLDQIGALGVELGASLFFGDILHEAFIGLFPQGVVNIHPAMLPYNRGCYPNVWSIVDETPAGVTLHYVDPGIDTGDIISQQHVRVDPWDTGQSLYTRLETACLDLLREAMPAVLAGEAPRVRQPRGGTFHLKKDVRRIDEIRLDRAYAARELINLLRARTFPPHKGAYFIAEDGRRIYLRLDLEPEPESGERRES